MPTTFTVVPINRVIVTSTGPNVQGTRFMADAVLGIVCEWAAVHLNMQR
jgi:hypothetical protein